MPDRIRWIAAIALLLISWPVSSSESPESKTTDRRNYGEYFNGSFVEYAIRGGMAGSVGEGYGGYQFDLGIRQSFPMYIADTRLSYRYDRLRHSESSDRTLRQHGLGLALNLHPGYIFILGSDRMAYAISSVYIQGGASANLGSLQRTEAAGVSENINTSPGGSLSAGIGIDIPITDPDRGQSLWLNLLYRYQVDYLPFAEPIEDVPSRRHLFFGGLGWRYNGLLF